MENWSLCSLQQRLMAGAFGFPFIPTNSVSGSNIASENRDHFMEMNDPFGSEKNTGFLYYPPKPYLLVEEKDNSLATKIISLPDLSRPHRVKQDNGWGSAELSFVIENGMIKSFNSKTGTALEKFSLYSSTPFS